jgi:hypothetical protein
VISITPRVVYTGRSREDIIGGLTGVLFQMSVESPFGYHFGRALAKLFIGFILKRQVLFSDKIVR